MAKSQFPLKSVPKVFRERVAGKVNYFNPYGVFPAEEAAKDEAPPKQGLVAGFQGSGSMAMFKGKMNMAKTKEGDPTEKGTEAGTSGMSENGKVLLRFLDADVQPGLTYQYYVFVRMANPNYGKEKEVAFAALAKDRELKSPGTFTPTVTIPGTFHFYVVDQHPLETRLKGPNTIDYSPPRIPDGKLPVQIHQWETEPAGDQVHDWVIAERLLLSRGEIIGRGSAIDVEVPVWDDQRTAYHLGSAARQPDPKAKRPVSNPNRTALPVKFGLGDASVSPVLVDFAVGQKYEDGNVEALIVAPDGSLVVRSSREDTDADSPIGKDRIERYEAWKKRIQELRNAL